MLKQFVADYLNFTKKERTGILVLLLMILLCILLPFLYPFFIKSGVNDHTQFAKEIASLQIKLTDSTDKYVNRNVDADNYQNFYQPSERDYTPNKLKGELFYFDPNTLDEVGWRRLGIRDKTIATIKNFTSKGGKFYKPEDISKIWGLHEDEVERLVPYIQIQQNSYTPYEKKEYPKTTYTPSTVDINESDTTAWIALPFIGSKLAQRIITFRTKLGGFNSIEQVAETFGLPDSTFQKIKPRLTLKNSAVNTMNINTATLEELKAHPYLRYKIGNAIFQYRLQHGDYKSVTDLKKLMLVTDEIYNKAAPYLRVN